MEKIKTEVYSATDVGLKRKENEDSCATLQTSNGYLCVVCDGMGGHQGGATASRIAVDCIAQYMNKEVYTDIRQALTDALEFANMQIVGTASEHPELSGMGTTACVLLIQDENVWLAHAGDSRIYLFVAKERRLHRLTKDHSYVQGLVDQGIITEAEAESHPYKNRILKALGVSETLNPEVCRQAVHPAKGDIFLICSDGLSGMVSDKLIQETLLPTKITMKQKVSTLMSLAKAAGGTDNITIQMALVTESPYKKSVFESKNLSLPSKQRVGARSRTRYATIAAALIAGILIGLFFNRAFRNENSSKEPALSADSTRNSQQNPQDSLILSDDVPVQSTKQDTSRSPEVRKPSEKDKATDNKVGTSNQISDTTKIN
jgi:protein phosphatase